MGAFSPTLTAWSGPWGVSFSANLTPDPETGVLRDFTEQQFIQTMRTGRHLGQGRQILPPMPWQVYGNMTDEDLKAVYAYLRQIHADQKQGAGSDPAGKVIGPVAAAGATAAARRGSSPLKEFGTSQRRVRLRVGTLHYSCCAREFCGELARALRKLKPALRRLAGEPGSAAVTKTTRRCDLQQGP